MTILELILIGIIIVIIVFLEIVVPKLQSRQFDKKLEYLMENNIKMLEDIERDREFINENLEEWQ